MTKIKLDLVDKFYNIFRYLDDVLSLNNPEYQKFAKNLS